MLNLFRTENPSVESGENVEPTNPGKRNQRRGIGNGHRFLANAFRLFLHGTAYNLVNLFRLQLPQPWRSAQIETLRAQLFKIAPASAKPPAVSASTCQPAGSFRTCSAPLPSPSTAVDPILCL